MASSSATTQPAGEPRDREAVAVGVVAAVEKYVASMHRLLDESLSTVEALRLGTRPLTDRQEDNRRKLEEALRRFGDQLAALEAALRRAELSSPGDPSSAALSIKEELDRR